MTQELVKYDAMCRAISEAYRIDEVKDIRDLAIKLELYARQAHNVEAERQACEIRLRAERKGGEVSRELDKSKGGRPADETRPTHGRVLTKTEQLNAAGISRRQAQEWEKLAAVPAEQFEHDLATMERPTRTGIIRKNALLNLEMVPVAGDALWPWGRLLDFERDGLLAKEPSDVLLIMTDHMRDDVHRLAPMVSAWLRRIGET